MYLSEMLSKLLNQEVVFNNGKYYMVDDDGELIILSTMQALSLCEQIMN